MKILITGGAGYIGTELIKRLIKDKSVNEIIVFDNLYKGSYSLFTHPTIGGNNIRLVQSDILDTRMLRKTLEGVDVVYHLAARIQPPFAEVDPHFFEQVNHWGTAELSYAIEETPSISKVVHVSSTAVYGSSGKEIITEKSMPNPKTNYAISKLRGEGFMQRLMDKKNVLILRIGNVYGFSHSMRFDAVINRFAFEANFIKRLNIHGNGTQSRAFIHIDALSEGLSQLATKEIPSGIYNFVAKNYAVMDIALALKDLLPNIEMLFINQHLKLRDLQVSNDCPIYNYISKEDSSLKLELIELINQFAFHP
jgi:UDP-glucose 4-epimerase